MTEPQPRRRRTARELRQPRPPLPENVPLKYRGLAGFIAEDPEAFAKGVATMPFTAAPDIVGLASDVAGGLSRFVGERTGLPTVQFGRMSGDPIRELVGLDPASPQGIAGEVVSPAGTAAKLAGIAGKAITAGAKLAAGSDFPAQLAMTLFHGTPHKFKKFETAKIGTGEGAQAYGHGLYFAERPGVARSYRNKLTEDVKITSPTGDKYDVKVGDEFFINPEFDDKEMFRIVSDLQENFAAGGREFAQADIQTALDAVRMSDGNLTEAEIILGDLGRSESIEILHSLDIKRGGHLCEVEIPDEITDQMLHWDLALSEQPEQLQKMVDAGMLTPNEEFSAIYGRQMFGTPKGTLIDANSPGRSVVLEANQSEEFSRALREAGIPGIRFLDQQSRIAGKPRKTMIQNFLDAFPEDAGFEEVEELIGTGHFSKEQDAVLKALREHDWLGFDYPSQAINVAYNPKSLNMFDPASDLVRAVEKTIDPGATSNVVLFNADDIAQVKRDGDLVFKKGKELAKGGPVVAARMNALRYAAGGYVRRI